MPRFNTSINPITPRQTDGVTGFGTGGLGRFKGDPRATDWALENLPFDLLQRFDELAQFGKFGERGVGEIVGAERRTAALNRRLRRKGRLRQSGVGRRLGPRAGAVESQLADEGLQTELAASRRGAALRAENLASRVGGLQGIAQIMQFLQQRYEARENREGQGSGVLDIVGPLTTIAATAFGGPAGGAASEGIQRRIPE